MKIIKIDELSREQVKRFFKVHWGSSEMVISSGIYDCSELDGFIFANDLNEIIGLITFIITNNECEIISLDSIDERKGIGSLLVQEIENLAVKKKFQLIKLVTTNDNLLALKFYQKRGFQLSKIYINAVEKARKLKPEIPLIGNDGIPIRDEIELKKLLS